MTTTSMRKFSVHFRRSPNYTGEYGFDWLRDEYIYDLKTVAEVNAKTRLYRGEVKNLIQEYTHFENVLVPYLERVEKAHGEQYIPAWLAIFPSSKYTGNKDRWKDVNINGANLYLQIDQDMSDTAQELSLTDDTELVFRNSSEYTVTPSSVKLKDVLKNVDTKNEVLVSSVAGIKTKKFRRYINNHLAINIVCNKPLDRVGFVQVVARKGNTEKIVGILLCYPTAKTLYADIISVHFCSKPKTERATVPANYHTYIETKSFSQALVKSHVKRITWFNITDKLQEYQNKVANKQALTTDEKNKMQVFKEFLTKYPVGKTVPPNLAESLKRDIIKIYEMVSTQVVPKDGIESKANKTTFLIFTDYHVANQNGTTLGSAMTVDRTLTGEIGRLFSGEKACFSQDCPLIWGNAVVLFETGNTQLDTLAHELGHSFSLPHTFTTPPNTKHTFYMGYTDNLMDYDYNLKSDLSTPAYNNTFKGSLWSLFKWQWDILRMDKSIRNK